MRRRCRQCGALLVWHTPARARRALRRALAHYVVFASDAAQLYDQGAPELAAQAYDRAGRGLAYTVRRVTAQLGGLCGDDHPLHTERTDHE